MKLFYTGIFRYSYIQTKCFLRQTNFAESQEFLGSLNDVADEEEDETFIIVHLEGGGMYDQGKEVSGLGGLGSWNCSRTDGKFGAPCSVPRPQGQDVTCYSSCGCMCALSNI